MKSSPSDRSGLSYLLITPARNEDAFIELTIDSVINQTVRPLRWLIVSDGSTDRTDEIIAAAARKHDWIELLRMPERTSRDFGGKAHSFNTGYDHLKHLPHEVVVSLDADITFAPDYFEFLLGKLAATPQLGLVGTPFAEDGHTYDYRFSSVEHVSGACQVFRRECLETVGGYVQSKGGGIDVIAVLSARMNGWGTRTFTEKHCDHHRPMGSAQEKRKIMTDFALGRHDYCLGFHPIWQVFRSIHQMSRRPYIVGGAALLTGYFWAMLNRYQRSVGRDLLAFQQQDQMRRLRKFFRIWNPGSRVTPLFTK